MDQISEEIGEESQIDIRHYLRVVRKRKWTILAVFVILVLTVVINDFTKVPIYEASARMIIEKSNPNVVSIQEVMAFDSWDPDYKETQFRIIQSRSVARSVIKKMNLADSEEFKPQPAQGIMANFRNLISNFLRGIKGAVVGLLKKEEKKPRPGTAPQDEEEYLQDSGLVSNFVGRISVRPVQDSRLVDIGFRARDPQAAVKIVNGLAQAYIEHNMDLRLGAIKDAMAWMNERIGEERSKVEAAERNLQQYREREEIITEFSGEVETVTAQKLAQLNTQVVGAESARVEAETKYRQALQMKNNPLVLDSIPEVLDNRLIQTIKESEVDLYKSISELSKKYGKQHPKMQATYSELATLQERKATEIERVVDSLRNEYEVSLAREKSLVAALERQKQESLQLNKKAIVYSVLNREAESARELYDMLIRRFKETSVTKDIDTSNLRIIDRAEYGYKVSPDSWRNMKMAAVIGLMLGLGLAFLFEYLDNTFKSPEEVEQFLKIPLLGVVLAHTVKGRRAKDVDKKEELISLKEPRSSVSESYRGIRTRILFSIAETQPKIILMASATEQEGKTLTSANLAVIMAKTGSRVLLMDCDMRKPRLNRIFGVDREKGVSNVLVGDCSFADAVQETEITNLHLIPCGHIPPNPSELLGSRAMRELLTTLSNDYDRILIDSSPVSAVTDAVVLSKIVDGVVLVVQANRTEREVVRRSVDQLVAVNAQMLGVILNRFDIDLNKYYNKYSYFYGYYGQEKKEDNSGLKRGKRKQNGKS